MKYFWWDDAVALAVELSRGTLIRHKVTSPDGGWSWIVDLADDAVALEPCS